MVFQNIELPDLKNEKLYLVNNDSDSLIAFMNCSRAAPLLCDTGD